MKLEVRREVSELAFAYADVMQALARFELEDTAESAIDAARRLDRLSQRAMHVKGAMRQSFMASAGAA